MKTFNASRTDFEPYGLTCEQWETKVMPRFDRHNEIELNYFPEGGITYFFQNRHITLPPHRIILFWGLMPHRIISFDVNTIYYVCTIPLSLFLRWGLPKPFTDRLFKGDVLIDKEYERYIHYDSLLMENWHNDLSNKSTNHQTVILEMQSRIKRLSTHFTTESSFNPILIKEDSNLIEQMVQYIACNYHRDIHLADIGKAMGLHPDYANTLFKKNFGHTLNSHILLERITQAQRMLLTTSMPVVQIAYDCGFNSVSCFNRAFLQLSGCTPREYRKREQYNINQLNVTSPSKIY